MFGGFLLFSDTVLCPCFTPGTLIATESGWRPVEALRRGDRIVTRDNGLKRIYWVGRKDLGYRDLQDPDAARPVLVRAGAFGEGKPARDMIVSPNHRFLVGPGLAPYDIGAGEALVAARHLVDRRSVLPAEMLGVSYIHLLCARHEVILADGVWTESFHPDDATMKALANAHRLELMALFPEIATLGASVRFPAARQVLTLRSRFET